MRNLIDVFNKYGIFNKTRAVWYRPDRTYLVETAYFAGNEGGRRAGGGVVVVVVLVYYSSSRFPCQERGQFGQLESKQTTIQRLFD